MVSHEIYLWILKVSSTFSLGKELKLRQRMWLELTKDYYLTLWYHPGKADVVTYVLSRTSAPKICMSVLDDLDRIGISL